MSALLAAAPIYGSDPLFNDGVDLTVVAIVVIKVLITFVLLLVSTMLMIWFERKLVSDMQNRIGPNRAGPWGMLQTLADGIKVFYKEDLIPDQADRKVFILAPYLAAVPAFLSFAIVPIGPQIEVFGRRTNMQLADPPIGILWLLAMSSIAVYGIMLAGWASGSKYPLIGSVRASAQMVSYEAALGLSVVAVVVASGSLLTSQIVASQSDGIFEWNILATGVVPFIVFCIAATAELNRPPFDLVEAEQELVGGFHTEYSSIRFALFYLAEFMNTVTMSAVIVTLFLGGPSDPFGFTESWPAQWAVGLGWFFLKIMVFLGTYVWIRATLPRFRYDQLMDLGWKKLIPISLGWVLILVAIRISDGEEWTVLARNAGAMIAVTVLAGLVLTRAITLGRRAHEQTHATPADIDPGQPPASLVERPSTKVSD